MGLDFLRDNGARRVRDFAPQPQLINDGVPLAPTEDKCLDLSFEMRAEAWQPHAVGMGNACNEDWAHRPSRFVDGKDVGRTIAWLQSREGYPVPVRLSEIGAVALRTVETADGERALRREWNKVERVVSFMADLFPWDEVEEFAIGLQGSGFRLLPVRGESADDDSDADTLPARFDFERMRQKTFDRTKDEMIRLEREALSCALDAATIVDGGLDARSSAFAPTEPVIGLIKTHSKNYLHHRGWRTFYELKPGERTPAFALSCRNVDVISWYLRMDGARGELPNWGVVRVEVPQTFFDSLGEDWGYLDRVSRLICDYRCRDESYGRAAVTIHPIQRAEQSLGALFTQSDVLISRFYHLTNL